MVKKILCDICGCETDHTGGIKIDIYSVQTIFSEDNEYDLCMKCAYEFYHFIHRQKDVLADSGIAGVDVD